MGQGKEVKTRPDPEVEIQEKGEIFFFYRPKVGKDEAHGPDDVQRMYIVLRPESAGGGGRTVEEKQAPDSGKEGRKRRRQGDGAQEESEEKGADGGHGKEEVNIEDQPLLRLVVMGRKSLPDPAKHSRPYWGYVELVTTKVDDIKDALKEEEYSTATRGKRHRAAARALGEGVYRIVKHESESGSGGRRRSPRPHTHLVYKLELPSTRGAMEPQEAMNVEPEASFLVQVKNPDPPSGGRDGGFRGLQSKRRAAFPAHLQDAFGGRRYAPADPPDLLNYEGCELLLIAASDDVEDELGLQLEGEVEDGEGEGVETPQGALGCSDLVKMFGEVADVKPLLSGSWD
ncbi:hypothetical protein Zm00014a_011921 [Zea mays]|uniref:Uncharacterized protein n=3 Tax=Zea mays TaxID=4577 RepID=A0A1D6IKD3_MAIZE|nr:uncharacterized protein LOC103633444 [Zea mays]ONM59866.1 hypothetical protein ZEAMMB73_Zm00001d022204 [Zea mays]PWZ14586.1 hypothetical protein Zm00014a_011921 [Zea mays]|eukprot:XP_008653367.1 uncharacterized protein LOC103633444 [Zea mays]